MSKVALSTTRFQSEVIQTKIVIQIQGNQTNRKSANWGAVAMPGFWVRFFIIACGLLLAAWLLEGIRFGGVLSLLFAALVLGMVNAVVRPILLFLTLPITVITLGLFLLILNGAMLGLAALLVPGFVIDGFWSALFGAIIVSLTGMVANWFIGPKGNVEIIVMRR